MSLPGMNVKVSVAKELRGTIGAQAAAGGGKILSVLVGKLEMFKHACGCREPLAACRT